MRRFKQGSVCGSFKLPRGEEAETCSGWCATAREKTAVSYLCVHRAKARAQMNNSGYRVQGSGVRVRGAGCRVQGSGFRAQGSGFRVQGSGFRVLSTGYSVRGPGRRCTQGVVHHAFARRRGEISAAVKQNTGNVCHERKSMGTEFPMARSGSSCTSSSPGA